MASPTAAALALSLLLVAWAVVMRVACGTWLNPSAFFALWWSVAGILPLIATPYDPVSPGAVLFIVAASISVSAGAAIGNGGFRTKLFIDRPFPSHFELKTLKILMIVALIAGMLSNIAYAVGSGVALRDLLNIQQLVIVSNQLYVARYATPDAVVPPPPFLSQALLPFVFLAPALGGLVFVLSRRKLAKILALASMAPAIAVTVLQNTKAAVLFGGILWASGYFASRLRLGRIAVFTKVHVAIAAGLSAVVTVFFIFVSLARLASTDLGLLDVVRVKLFTSAFGHMTVFSQWLSDYWNHADFSPTLGGYTFSGPLEALGIQQRMPGIFVDFVELAVGDTSNIHTAFRFLIQDFTIPGALVVLGIVGLIGGISFRLVSAGRWAAVPFLIGTYATIMWSPIAWFWIYNSLTATVASLALLFLLFRTLRVSRALKVPLSKKVWGGGQSEPIETG
jgi:oligosaccharide repeat unit polymerase